MRFKNPIGKFKFSELGFQLPSLCLLIMTIVAAFASLYAGGNGSKAILSQDKATDAWAYYQSNSMKQTMYNLQLEELQYDYPATADKERFEQLKKRYEDNIAKYETSEMKQIEKHFLN